MPKQTRAQRDEARRRLDEERARQKQAEQRRTLLAVLVGVVAVVLIAGAVVWGVANQDDDDGAGATLPAAVGEPGAGIGLGPSVAEAEAAGVPTVEVFTDFLCSHCQSFEQESGETLSELAAEGAARVVYHPVNLIGSNLGMTSSTRVGGAAGCASDVDAFVGFRDVAFANQPGTDDEVTDEQIVAWGEAAGIEGEDLDTFEQCVAEERYVDWVKQEWSKARDRNVTSTPTVLVAGRELTRNPNEYTPAGLRAAVAGATRAADAEPTDAPADESSD